MVCPKVKLNDGEEGITDETHKIVETESTDATERWQYVKVQNENAKLFRMLDCKTEEDRQKAIERVKSFIA